MSARLGRASLGMVPSPCRQRCLSCRKPSGPLPKGHPPPRLSPEILGEPPARGLCPHFCIVPRAGSPRRHCNCLVIIQCQGRRWAMPALGSRSPSSSHLAGPGTPAPCLHAQPVLGTTQGFPKLWIGPASLPQGFGASREQFWVESERAQPRGAEPRLVKINAFSGHRSPSFLLTPCTGREAAASRRIRERCAEV